jgi:uncharacterized membrane protein YheB (UPF0754 family)
MLETLRAAFEHPDFWKYASIPVVAGLVGWITNWIAIVMTFKPLEFVGLRPLLGWQGIIPSKAEKMATTFVDSTMSRLGTFPELFRYMEPEKIAAQIDRVMQPRLIDYTDDVMTRTNPVLWDNLPAFVKEIAYAGVKEKMPTLIANMMREAETKVEDLLDFKHMIVTRLTGDKILLNRLFLESGAAEFRFIINSGFWFGLLFGLVQLAVWIVYPQWWVLPLFGLIVGWATNWLAINIIFRPLEPRRLGPWVLQGLFLKRQREVAGVWTGIVTREILTIRRLVDAMLHGPRGDNTRRMIRRHVKPVVDEAVELARPLAQVAVGPVGFSEIKKMVGEKAVEVSIDPFDDPAFVADRAVLVENLLRDRMESLPSAQFQDLLRPCFQEDEWKLIALGAVLGLAAGVAQLVFVF